MYESYFTSELPKLAKVWSRLLLMAFLLFCAQIGFSQSTVTGRLIDTESNPLIGATVLVKGTPNGTVTDANGNYKLNVPPGATTLVISYTGYDTQEVAINGQSAINLTMIEGASMLSEAVINVGYAVQKKSSLTGAVSQIGGTELLRSPAVEISNSLAGRLPGVVVIQTSGEPGNDGATINIRGINTLGNSSPLIVIDGIPDRDGGLGRLSSQDIESISVLKDASAAIYGARAANGAILVTTKRGKSGKPTISYSFNQGFSQPTVVPKMSGAVEYANIMNELPIYRTIPANEWGAASASIKSTGTYDSPTAGVATLNANYSPDAVRQHGAGTDKWAYPDTDWFGDAFRTWTPQSRHDFQLSGGSENIRYMTSLGYLYQDAIYKKSATFYKQYNARVNLDAKVNKYISANFGAMIRREDRNAPTESTGAIFRMLMRGRPTEPEVWPNGKPGPDIENGQNPYVITTNETGYSREPKDYQQLNGGVDITNPWIEGLKLSLSGAIDRNSSTQKVWQTPWELYKWDRVSFEADGVTPKLKGDIRSNFTDPRLFQAYGSYQSTNLTSMLSYDVSKGIHGLNIMAGVTKEESKGDFFGAYRRNFISSGVDQIFAGGSDGQNTLGSAFERARLGYFGRVKYNLQEKYLAEFIWRYDGSYIFPKASRFGFFPGLSLGWNVSSEPFMENLKAVNFLKLRASYGQMGNDQVAYDRNRNGRIDQGELQEYAYLSTYGFGAYPINSTVVKTLSETILANPDFTWERANNLNFGIDATLFNRIELTLEFFKNKRDQILIQKTGSTPASSGISTLLPPVNAGQMTNKGVEFNLGYNSSTKNKLQFHAGVGGGFAKNKVDFLDEVPGIPDYQKQEGKPYNSYLVYEADGAFLDQAAIDANSVYYGGVTAKLLPGDLRIKDHDGNDTINANDQVRQNFSDYPTFNFGANFSVNYGGFDFSMLLQGATGAKLRIATESGDIGNFLQYSHDNRWSIDNPSSTDPRLASRGDTYYTGGNFGNNTYFLFSKNYIRLKNVELGYALPRTSLEKYKISGLRIYVNGLNLLTFAGNSVFDPESTNSAGTNYPQSRVINTGLTLTF
jgi:TonB-dependent starch-binding outer membrane protein SusC